MYMKRKIDDRLQEWASSAKRKPLLVRGVRQCGKTSAIRRLGESFDYFVEINLERNTGLHSAFENDIDVERIIARLELETNRKIVPQKTLLFIDEIQACPRAITALRYFYEEKPELHVVAAGSLLEFVLNDSRSKEKLEFPVGRVRSIFMYPFSFEEFLKGMGQEILADYLESRIDSNEKNDAHGKLLDWYKIFLLVGGMPEAVAEYNETGSLLACRQVHRDIILNFRDDFDKYDQNVPADVLQRVFAYAVHNVCAQTKATSAIQGVSAYYFDECIKLLRRAGLVYPVKACSGDAIPLGASEKETNKKLLLFDTGVYLTECGLDTGELLATEVFDEMNKGSVVELQTGLEMIKSTDVYAEPSLFYWYRTGANAEVDYVIMQHGAIVPVEVKASGKGRMQSLRSFLRSHPNSPYGIRVSLENFTKYEDIRVFPVYAAGWL